MFRKILFTLLLLSIPALLSSQPELKEAAEGIRLARKAAAAEREAIIAEIISYGTDIVPYLIGEIASTKKIPVDTLLGVSGGYTVGDLAVVAIREIVFFPFCDIAGVLPGKGDDYYQPVWKELHASRENRREFRDELLNWYENNKGALEELNGRYYPEKQTYEPCDEDIIVDYLLRETDRHSEALYLIKERFARFVDIPVSDWDSHRSMSEDEKTHLRELLSEMKEYYDDNHEEDSWNPDAPILRQRRFSKFKIVPEKKYYRYLMGEGNIPAGSVYHISKPLYDKSGNYAMINVSWSPKQGGHGIGGTTYILRKSSRGWEVFKSGPVFIS